MSEDMKERPIKLIDIDDMPVTVKTARPNGFIRFLKTFIIWKGDKVSEIIRKTVFTVSLAVAVVCFTMIFNNIGQSNENEMVYNEIADIVEQFEMTGHMALPQEVIEEIREEVPGILDKYIELYNLNNDMVGWLTIPTADGFSAMGPVGADGRRRGYPVLQRRWYREDGTAAGSNFYYLKRDFNHKEHRAGAIYAEWRIPITATSRPNNTIIYGHNMGDGSMFAPVVRFYPFFSSRSGSLDFYRNHPIIQFDTLYEEGLYKIFAVMYTHVDEEKFDDVYDYHRKREFPDKESFFDFAQNILDRSAFYNPDVDLMYGDEIITLSTCYFTPLGRSFEARVALFARRVREGESAEVDVSRAYINHDPLYFDHYYSVFGGSWGGRKWDLGMVEGLEEFLAENPQADTSLNR